MVQADSPRGRGGAQTVLSPLFTFAAFATLPAGRRTVAGAGWEGGIPSPGARGATPGPRAQGRVQGGTGHTLHLPGALLHTCTCTPTHQQYGQPAPKEDFYRDLHPSTSSTPGPPISLHKTVSQVPSSTPPHLHHQLHPPDQDGRDTLHPRCRSLQGGSTLPWCRGGGGGAGGGVPGGGVAGVRCRSTSSPCGWSRQPAARW